MERRRHCFQLPHLEVDGSDEDVLGDLGMEGED